MYSTSLYEAKLNDEVWHNVFGLGSIQYTEYDDEWIQIEFEKTKNLKWFTKKGESVEYSNVQELF